MSDTAGSIIGLAIWFAMPALPAWFAIEGLRKGVIRVRGGEYSRTDDGMWFWACEVLYLGFVAFWACLTISAALV